MTLSHTARLVADAFALGVAVFFVVMIAWRIGMRGLRGLLASKTTAARVTPERLQLLVVTLLFAGWYTLRVLAAQGSSIPPVNSFCMWAFGISCSIYAVGNAVRSLER